VDGAQVGILKETHQVCFGSLLKSQNGSRLESEVRLEVLSNFTDKTLERGLADQEIRGLLVLADLAKSDGTWAVSVRLLDTSGSGGGLAGSLLIVSKVIKMMLR
jgi:hypothetical protein